ncbi:MAG: hypothetical protein K0Q73_5213 [Paenibacillus sp.]|jgi:hypothetical protein|nr:hypothetical protein [Paenibacillus sp.]
MWGVAIGYIITGAAQYKFRKQLHMIPSVIAERIGFSLWWGGWFMLCWWLVAALAGWPPGLKFLGLAAVTFWVGLRGIQSSSQLLAGNTQEYETKGGET